MQKNYGIKRLSGLNKIVGTASELKAQGTITAACIMSLGFSFALLAAYIDRTQQSVIEPYLITVDSHGVVLDRGTVSSKIAYESDIPLAVVDSMLSDFIRDLRTVTLDKHLQARLINKVYSYIKQGSAVHSKVNSFYTASNPMSTTQRGFTVQVEIVNLIHLDEHTVQIDWNETVNSNSDLGSNTVKKRALITFNFATGSERSASTYLDNPLQLFINELLISDVLA